MHLNKQEINDRLELLLAIYWELKKSSDELKNKLKLNDENIKFHNNSKQTSIDILKQNEKKLEKEKQLTEKKDIAIVISLNKLYIKLQEQRILYNQTLKKEHSKLLKTIIDLQKQFQKIKNLYKNFIKEVKNNG